MKWMKKVVLAWSALWWAIAWVIGNLILGIKILNRLDVLTVGLKIHYYLNKGVLE